MGVVIAVDDALERVRLLDARRQGRGRWGSSHFPEPDAALNTGQTRTSGALDIKWQPLQLAVRQYLQDQQRSGYQINGSLQFVV